MPLVDPALPSERAARMNPRPLDLQRDSLPGLFSAIADGASQREAERRNPVDEVRALAAAGLGTLRVPAELGGAGASLRDTCELVVDLARADANVAHALRSHFLITESRRHLGEGDRWLAEAAAGRLFGIAAAERATTRIDSRDYGTTLTRVDGGWRLRGEKSYSTGSLFADWIQVPAKLAGSGELQVVFVASDAEGVDHLDDWDGFGQRLTGSGTTVFADVFVPQEAAVTNRPLNGSGDISDYRGAFGQLYLQAVLAGIIASAADSARDVVRGRTRSFSHASAERAADDPLVQHVAGQIDSWAFVARAAVLGGAEALDRAAETISENGAVEVDRAHAAALDVARIKPVVEELALRAGSSLFEVGGASTTSVRSNLDRHWRNARTVASHNPTIFKTRAVGDFLINQNPLPATGFF